MTTPKRPPEKMCGAKVRPGNGDDTGKCRQWAMANGRCRLHGGRSIPPGPAHPTWKNGRSSKYIPKNLVKEYEEALADPEYRTLKNEIATLKLRENQLLRRLDGAAGSAAGWRQVATLAEALAAAVVDDDRERILGISAEITEVTGSAKRAEETWKDIQKLENDIRRMKGTEARIRHGRDMLLDKERAIMLVIWLLDVVRENVKDREALHRIGSQVRTRLIPSVTGAPIEDAEIVL